jgi:hypothetical protein
MTENGIVRQPPLEKLGLGQYAQRFAENDISLSGLPDLANAALLPSQFGSAPDLDVLNPGHRQIVEAILICLEAISRAKAHSVVAMEYEAK